MHCSRKWQIWRRKFRRGIVIINKNEGPPTRTATTTAGILQSKSSFEVFGEWQSLPGLIITKSIWVHVCMYVLVLVRVLVRVFMLDRRKSFHISSTICCRQAACYSCLIIRRYNNNIWKIYERHIYYYNNMEKIKKLRIIN